MCNDHYEPEFHDSFSGLTGMRRFGANYIWLVYSVFFFIEPVLQNSLLYWAKTLVIYAAFLPVYIYYVETKRPQLRLPLVVVIFLFGVATIHWNQGGTFFAIFASALSPFAVRRTRSALMLMVGDAAIVGGMWFWFREDSINYTIAIIMIFITGLANLFMAEQKRSQCKLEKAREENAALAQVAERERIARDLHDVLGHTLSVIVLKAELASRLLGRDTPQDQAPRRSRDCRRRKDCTKPPSPKSAKLSAAIVPKVLQAEVDMARMTLDAAGVTLACETMPPTLTAREETALALSVREAVTNIVRHAQATECTLRFAVTPDGFTTLEVEDNGRTRVMREGHGLRGMRARVEELGGRFRIERASNQGTRLVIELPARSPTLASEN